jgi:hypothetical protein
MFLKIGLCGSILIGDMDILYLFIDETGDTNFSPTGSKFWLLTCASTLKPLEKQSEFSALKYKLLGDGLDQECFHASEDRQIVRDAVFALVKNSAHIEIDSVVVQKNKTNFTLYEDLSLKKKASGGTIFKTNKVEEKLHKQVSETLLKYIIYRYVNIKKIEIEKVIVVFDAMFTTPKQEYVKKHLKTYFKEKTGKVPYIYFHQVKADINCQIADYCGWAIGIKWERNELRPYNLINDKIKSEFDIFQAGDATYYQYKK